DRPPPVGRPGPPGSHARRCPCCRDPAGRTAPGRRVGEPGRRARKARCPGMMTLTAVFWMYVILFGIIGGFRGWAKELLVLFSVLLAIAIDTVLLTYVESVKVVMTTRPGITQFALRSSLILTL